ncbi:protein GDAP2 homolog [Monomorium pharaonis]|uniref:protein GDAP2 homolog n=1 Tax=Monomorium pharaonis TaxID=307658 RepID=UPI00063F227C|nr:protein GDAP2 homolog [Monomorium pharaonis]XP_012534678.1 protein GDAP2 homolog [Monomorium pharaonis]
MMESVQVPEDLIINPDTLRPWSLHPTNHQTNSTQENGLINSGITQDFNSFPFRIEESLNSKLILWSGNITLLNVDVIINPTNVTFNDENKISQSIIAQGGEPLVLELKKKSVKSGEIKITEAFNMPAQFIMHIVGLQYNSKQHISALDKLHCCYRNILEIAKEKKWNSLALPIISLKKGNCPEHLAAHVAIKTIRKFMEEHNSSFSHIILVLLHSEFTMYEAITALYFPRNEVEQIQSRLHFFQLSNEVITDEDGTDKENIFPVNKQINIINNPQHILEGAELIELETIENGEFGLPGELDREKLLGSPALPLADGIDYRHMQQSERYERLLRRAKMENLGEISGIGCLYQSGVDRQGRPVIVFLGKWFPASKINLEKAKMYLISILDPIVRGDYVIAYFHTLTNSNNHPTFQMLYDVYSVLPYKYKKNLKHFYIVHPTFWTKMMTWWFTTFMAPAIKRKVQNIQGLAHLYELMSPDQLEIPAYITEYDMKVNGLQYFHTRINLPSPTST